MSLPNGPHSSKTAVKTSIPSHVPPNFSFRSPKTAVVIKNAELLSQWSAMSNNSCDFRGRQGLWPDISPENCSPDQSRHLGAAILSKFLLGEVDVAVGINTSY